MATYFGSKPVSDWTANGPAESGHNFIDQINEQKGKVTGQENKVAEQQNILGEARNAYNDAYQNQQNYSDLYGKAKEDEGVLDAKNQYQKSLASVNATQSAMNNLPSSINAGSNVVLNASQRNAALGNQMTKFQNTLDYQTRQNAGDLSQYQTALASAQDLAKSNMSQEQAKVAQTMQNYQSQMDYANNLYNQLLQERQIMRSIYGDMYEDEYRHMQRELEIWADNLQAETARYAQDQETARNNAKLAAEKEQGDINKYLGSGYIWDGSGWVKPTAPDTSKAKNIDDLNKLYAQYKSEIADLDNQTGNFLTYLNPFGSNGMLGHLGNGFTSDQSKALQNKGFTGYLQDASPVLYDTVMNNNDYADLLRIYGAGGSSRGGW
jgi:hypothetical protein